MCIECGSWNYLIGVSSIFKLIWLEVNKFCKYCKKYIIYKEMCWYSVINCKKENW